MRTLLALVLVPLACTGCIGSSGASAPHSHSEVVVLPPKPRPKIDVMITYTVGACPPGTRCAAASANPKYFIVSRQLTCSTAPATGNYPDPQAACRALTRVAVALDTHTVGVCGCPGHPIGYVYPKAVGYYDGKRRTIPLDGCSLCGLGGIGPELKVLLPAATG